MNGSPKIGRSERTYSITPGLHSHNARRRIDTHASRHHLLRFVRVLLFFIGIGSLAYYAYALSNQYIYQAYENWAFDQKIAGRQVTFTDYVRKRTPFKFLTGGRASSPELATSDPAKPGGVSPSIPSRPVEGSVLGRLQIARLNLSAIVREGVDDKTLSRAVGHLPYTALPGQTGNFALAAHRDTLFRALKDIQKDDRVTLQSSDGTYVYEVISTEIVKPSDLSVVQPEGSNKFLTMITCYPFYYVGSAPKRFIVRARLVESVQHSEGVSTGGSTQSQNTGPPKAGAMVSTANQPIAESKVVGSAGVRKPRQARGFSHFRRPRSSSASRVPGTRIRHQKPGFWRKLFHQNHT